MRATMREPCLPHGYVEIQKVLPPEGSPNRGRAITIALAQAQMEAEQNAGRPVELHGSRIEVNGAVTIMYAGFVPEMRRGERRTPPLPAKNMNGAEQRVLGQLVTDNLGGEVGFKEARFGAGVPVAMGLRQPGEKI